MNCKLFRKSISALALLLASATGGLTEQIEGQISSVGEAARVEIRLPVGAQVMPGDPVQILAEIPGLGLTAITTMWEVESVGSGTASAKVVGEPTGLPQVGYIARIDASEAVISTGKNVRTSDTRTAVSEAGMLYQRAADLVASNDRAVAASGVELLRQAASQRHPRAMTDLGAALMFGRGTAPDGVAAMELHRSAADLGDTRAMLRLGLAHASGAAAPFDRLQAFNWMEMAAENGDADGMYITAMIYEDGLGDVRASLPMMVHWLEKAAQNGHVYAMFVLGDIYLEGEDGVIPKDIVKTEQYWTMAAENGLLDAMENLAEFYEGEDTDAAARWAKAANAAPEPAQWREDPRCLGAWECYVPEIMGIAQAVLAPTTQPRATQEQQACDRLAATNNDPDLPDPDWAVPYDQVDGQRAIDACLADIERWPDTRRFHAQLATAYHRVGRYDDVLREAHIGADMGSGQAMAMIAIMYKNGTGVEQSAPMALSWFEKGAVVGNMTAMHFAAHMQLNGDGVPFDTKAAANWFQEAADIGSGEAMAQLGILYDNGQGVAYDPDKSAANLIAGLDLGSNTAKDKLMRSYEGLSPHTRTAVQQKLQEDGWYQGALDGKFGPQTLKALRNRGGG